MRYPRGNMIDVLRVAIAAWSAEEKKISPDFESAFVAGMKQVLAALERGETITLT